METELTPGGVSQHLGIAVTTLRTWHQRYGLGPTGHTAGSHRRYNGADIGRLETMRRLTSEGVPAAEAARIAKSGTNAPPEPARAGGGRAVPVGRAKPSSRGLAAAAMRLDMATVRTRISAEIAEHGVARVWTEMLVPVLVGIGQRHAATNQLIDVEHLLSRCVTEVLSTVPRPDPRANTRILLACADEEQHSLPFEALAAALAEQGIGSRMLGARVPPAALLDAVRRTGPAAVFVWSHSPETADPAQLQSLLDLPSRPAIVAAAGPGWTNTTPKGVQSPSNLDEAIALALAVSD